MNPCETPRGSKNFFDVPAEVITHNVLDRLKLNDLLRLRRVCKTTKGLTDDFIRLHVKSQREIIISSEEGWHSDENDVHYKAISMDSLLHFEIPVPTTKFSLDYGGGAQSIFENPQWKMEEFVDRFGNQITHLKMSYLSAPMSCQKENEFYAKLPNLKHLSIDSIKISEQDINTYNDKVTLSFPQIFKNLEHFSVKNYFVSKDNQWAKKYFWKLVAAAAYNLQSLGQPEYCAIGGVGSGSSSEDDDDYDEIQDEDEDADDEWETFQSVSFNFLHIILMVGRTLYPNKPSLQYYDLQWTDESSTIDVDPDSFAEFCKVCVDNNLKLLNVYTTALYGLEPSELQAPANCIVSMTGLSIESFAVEYPLLEKLSVDTGLATIRNYTAEITWEDFGIPTWPMLQVLELIVNSEELCDGYPTSLLFHLMFGVIPRPTLRELKLKFEPETDDSSGEESMDDIPVPRVKDIVSCCFNLRKLSIQNWNGTNKALSILWTGLPLLEEVSFEDCKTLGNVAFVGENTEKPTFLHLKNLRKLSFLRMEEMPKITDTVFQIVFRHLKIREFIIMSLNLTMKDCVPEKLKSITPKGIKALLTGEFAKTVEIFPFDCWALEGVTDEEFQSLKDQFRSSHLL